MTVNVNVYQNIYFIMDLFGFKKDTKIITNKKQTTKVQTSIKIYIS